mmetsp:Transcript_28893/g.43632  ORF Transcript_28893/g.43632 Transcript_28893/m.43632 type:complete len:136 (-) Transcript_28893:152-559(-)
MTILRSLIFAMENLSCRTRIAFFDQSPQLCLASTGTVHRPFDAASDTTSIQKSINGCINDLVPSTWLFAVPKSKVSHSRKRMKQFHKNHIPHKKNIVRCRRTGEVTLMHKLPMNWRDFIPTFEYEPSSEGESSKK